MFTELVTNVSARARILAATGLLGASVALPVRAVAQSAPRIVVGAVTDTSGVAVPWALVLVNDKLPGTVADDTGRFRVDAGKRDRATIEVRRIGFRPERFELAFGGDSVVRLAVRLTPAAQMLEAQQVRAAATIRALDAVGFYERLRDRKLGAGSGTFITPEELEARQPRLATLALEGVAGVKVARNAAGQGVPMARGGTCPMTIYLGGVRLQTSGTSVGGYAPGSMMGMMRGTSAGRSDPTLDELIAANDVAAIEVYPRGVNAPPRFQMTNGTCGVVAIWTGSRKAKSK